MEAVAAAALPAHMELVRVLNASASEARRTNTGATLKASITAIAKPKIPLCAAAGGGGNGVVAMRYYPGDEFPVSITASISRTDASWRADPKKTSSKLAGDPGNYADARVLNELPQPARQIGIPEEINFLTKKHPDQVERAREAAQDAVTLAKRLQGNYRDTITCAGRSGALVVRIAALVPHNIIGSAEAQWADGTITAVHLHGTYLRAEGKND